MTFASLTFASVRQVLGKFQDSDPSSVPAPDARLAEVERDLDRTSDAFVEALNLLDRCLPPSFSA
jgi:hypothetical protein